MQYDALVERVARAICLSDHLDWDALCAYEADEDAEECASATCVAAFFEDHDPTVAREQYRRHARAAIAALPHIAALNDELLAANDMIGELIEAGRIDARDIAALKAENEALRGVVGFALDHLNADTFSGDVPDEFHERANALIGSKP